MNIRKAQVRCALFGLLALLPAQAVWAACSPSAGLASINEIVDENNNKFIEIKRLSSALTWPASNPWKIEFCLDNGQCSGLIDLPEATESSSVWIVRNISKTRNPTIDLTGMDVRLEDSEGRTVDYVTVGGTSAAEDPDCPAGSAGLPFDNTLELVSGQSGKYARRSPDGTGDWSLASGASEGKGTEAESNDTAVEGPTLNIDNVTVQQGDVARFTVSLSSAAGRDFTFEFRSRDRSAIQGTDYEFTEGVVQVQAGQSQAFVEVQSLPSGAAEDRDFFVIIGNSQDSAGDRYGQFESQAGIGTITPVTSRLDRFRVAAAQNASVCAPLEVLVSARDASGNVIADYQGAVELRTSSGSGDWAQNPADPFQGSLTPEPDNDNNGFAEYQFVDSDGGAISLLLDNRTADQLRISVTDPAEAKDGVSDLVQFQDNAFLIESNDANGLDIIAERDHSFIVRAVRQNPADQSECGLITEYDGSVNLKAWVSRSADDAQGQAPTLATGIDSISPPNAQPGAANLTFDFSGGIAPLSLQTTDVGQYRLSLLDNTSGFVVNAQGDPLPVDGQSDLWTVRPERFDVTVPGNPGAVSATSPVFRRAGESFEVQVTAIGAAGNALVSYGNEGTPQGAVITSELVQPQPGDPGLLSGQSNLLGADFSSGRATVSDLSWNEAGILNLRVSNGAYLAVAPSVDGDSGNVGRFIPERFEVAVDSGELAAFCGTSPAFIYSGQSTGWSISPQLMLTAYGPGNYITKNYTADGFRKLVSSDIQRTAPTADNASVNASGVSFPISATLELGALSVVSEGVLSYQFAAADELAYAKTTDSKVAPFAPDFTVTVDSVVDSDGVSVGASFLVAPAAPMQVYFGRLTMKNVYGPENISVLNMPFSLQYWSGSRFVLNEADSCSAWTTADIADTENFHSLSANSGVFSGGESGPLGLVPNGATGTDQLTWNVDPWLQGDFDGDGTLENPAAFATFGVYRGNDRVIYWREAL